MSLSAEEALAIAKKHGLQMGDALALMKLADTPEAAERFAATFAAPAPDPNELIRAKIAAKRRYGAGGAR